MIFKFMNSLIKSLLKAKDEKEMKNLAKGLFTPSEIAEFEQRIQIVKMLKKGTPQHEIAEKLGVGVATVSRGAKEIKLGNFITIN